MLEIFKNLNIWQNLPNSIFFNYPNFNIISQSKGKFFFEDQQQIPTTLTRYHISCYFTNNYIIIIDFKESFFWEKKKQNKSNVFTNNNFNFILLVYFSNKIKLILKNL